MTKLTLQQRARRATTRHNNRVKRSVPLLEATGTIPDAWLTEPAEQAERLSAHGERFEEWRAVHEAGRRHLWAQAAAYRTEVAEHLSPEALAEMDARAERLPDYPELRASVWLNVLRGLWWKDLTAGADLPPVHQVWDGRRWWLVIGDAPADMLTMDRLNDQVEREVRERLALERSQIILSI